MYPKITEDCVFFCVVIWKFKNHKEELKNLHKNAFVANDLEN